MAPPFPSPVSEWHSDTYAAISPSLPSLSMQGKTVVITGAGTGIGREAVRAFAAANAASIHILGRTESSLKETKSIVVKEFPKTEVTVHVADVSDLKTVSKAAKSIGGWDVLVSNAGFLAKRATFTELDLAEWWTGYEVNVKGSVVLMQAFLPTRNLNAAVVAVSSLVIFLPPSVFPGGSSYVSSKIAQVKVFEFVAAEFPDLQVVTIHPGVVATAMNAKSEAKGLPMDDIALPAHFIVWASSAEAKFASGRFLSCNWDVEQLKGLEGKFKDDPTYLTSNILGWPFA